MIAAGDGVIAAVSGGPDSTALLYSLNMIRDEYGLGLYVWHLDHSLRPESGEEADHVRSLASDLGLPCTIDKRDVKAYAKKMRISVQEAGRELRYELLERECQKQGAAKIAIGHNADDCVETFFINLMRGSGIAGLGGIPPVSGRVIRPLIECDRSMIIEFLSAHRLQYSTDRSNADKRYLRNRIRLELIPVLKAFNPTVTDRITTTMSLLRDEEAWLAALSLEMFEKIADLNKGEVRISCARLAQSPLALKRRILRLAVAALTGSVLDIDFAVVQSIIDKTLEGGGSTNLLGGGCAMIIGSDLVLASPKEPFGSMFINAGGGEAQIDRTIISVRIASAAAADLPLEKGELLVDADKIDWPLEIRSRRRGDWFIPLGMKGKKKLSDFFIDEKIPRHRRDYVPVFADKSKVAAIGNLRIDERVKVTDKTKKVALLKCPASIC